jgi:DNA-binding NarL/FixJ family response regulator
MTVEVVPLVVVSQVFPARPSSIPEIRDFVRRCLHDSPLSEVDSREVSERVSRALLDAAGPEGAIQVSFRIFPEHVEVDVLRSQPVDGSPAQPAPAKPATPALAPAPEPPPPVADDGPQSFADWMAAVLRREGLTMEAAAQQLGVSVKTVSRWVGGTTEPRLGALRKIREVFGDVPMR